MRAAGWAVVGVIGRGTLAAVGRVVGGHKVGAAAVAAAAMAAE